jgi:cobalt-zinc-cadmium efflux system outer membrane protein
MPFGLKPAHGLSFICLFISACSVHAQPLDELLQRALSNNRDYLASVERVREAEAQLRQAGVRPAPSLDAEGGSTRLLGTAGSQEYSIAYSHPFETAGKRANRISVATLGIEIAKAEAGQRRRTLTLEVAQAYADALNAFRKAAVLAEVARIDAETLRLISARVSEGDAAPLERRLLETEIARNEAERALALGRQETSVLALERIGALPPGSAALTPDLPRTMAMPAVEQLLQKALEARPDLRLMRLLEQQAGASVELAKAESSPNITASARYAFRNSTFDQFGFDSAGALTPVRDRENVLSFGVSAPLFAGRKNQANVEAAVSRGREARLRREYLDAAVPSEVKLAGRNWAAAKEALEIYTARILPQAEKNLDVIRQAWQLGQSRFLDVLNEQRRLTDLHLSQVDAETAVMKAWAELEHAVGEEIR